MSALYTQISEAAAEQQQQVERSQAADLASRKPESAGQTKPPAASRSRRTRRPKDVPVLTPEMTDSANGQTAPASSSLLDEMQNGVEETKRPTERYSFEIFADQKKRILEIQLRYAKETGKQLSKSRIIREALEAYFEKALAEQ